MVITFPQVLKLTGLLSIIILLIGDVIILCNSALLYHGINYDRTIHKLLYHDCCNR